MFNIETEAWDATPEAVRNIIIKIAEELSATYHVLASERENQSKIIEAQIAENSHMITQLNEQIDILRQQHNEVHIFTSKLSSAIKRHRFNNTKKEKQIVLVSDNPTARLAKIAYGLTQADWDVILLHKNKLEFDKSFFSTIYQYSSAEEAVTLAALFNPVTYHVFSSWSYETAIQLIDANVGKITFDNYDQFGGMMLPKWKDNEYYIKLIDQEKYCLENATGICNRALSLQLAKKELHYKITKKQIFFPDYCWDKSFDLKPKRTDGIHLVFPGTFPIEQFNASPSLGIFDKEFIESLSACNIHYHLYPPISMYGDEEGFKARYKDFIELSEVNPFFHIHQFVPPEELISEISQYHVGISSHSTLAFQIGDSTYNPSAMKYFCANKAFDFLDAGLDVIFGASKLMEWLLKRNVHCQGAFSNEIAILLKNKSMNDYTGDDFNTRISEGRKKLSVKRNIPRLISFYESL
jgi:hypothetical protein